MGMKGSSVGLTLFVVGMLLILGTSIASWFINQSGNYYYVAIPVYGCFMFSLTCMYVGTIPDVNMVDIIATVGICGLLLGIAGAFIRKIFLKKELGL
jgi:hypothetical protein